MASQIKFIFFDMGKVLLNFDHQRLVDQTAKLSGSTAKDIEAILFQPPHDLENRFERGELNSIEFHQSFCEQSNCQVDHNELMLAIADIFWLNTPIVHVVAQLRSINFPMAVLSNTCSAHWEFAIKHFAVLRLFQQRVLSYEEQSMKPDAKIYDSAIGMANQLVSCGPDEIFFTDDREENVQAARAAGMQAEIYDSPAKLVSQLKAGGIQLPG